MTNKIKQIGCIFNVFKYNFYTLFCTLFKGRDRKCWLFGAWMGDKFSDNTRYLFQYLHENKEMYGIKEVAWATRNQNVFEMLKSNGYQTYLIGTPDSRRYHLKAGVHLICNADGNSNLIGDISTEYSARAIKIQLWHGTGIKASGNLKKGSKVSPLKGWIHQKLIVPLMTPGYWRYCFFLTTSEESQRVIMADNGIEIKKIIRAPYPRLCKCMKYMPNEVEMIDMIKSKKKEGLRVILYLPTFRKEGAGILMPDEIDGFADFLNNEKIFWIEKRHSADINHQKSADMREIISLASDYDINTLYPYIDLLLTDYSSAASDALFWGKPTVEYCPDYSEYEVNDRGFVAPFRQYHISEPVQSADKLFSVIADRLNNPEKWAESIEKISSFLFEDKTQNYDTIIRRILDKVNL